jgi:hypothetical protein
MGWTSPKKSRKKAPAKSSAIRSGGNHSPAKAPAKHLIKLLRDMQRLITRLEQLARNVFKRKNTLLLGFLLENTGFKVGLFALLFVFVFVSFSHFWRKNGEKETKRSTKRNAKRLL